MIEKLSENTLIFNQLYKRVWPSSQRDTCFVSHLKKLSQEEEGERLENEVANAWMVANFTTEHEEAPVRWRHPRFQFVTYNLEYNCWELSTPSPR